MKIAAIILAAGQSIRYGADNKLFAEYNGIPLVDHCLRLVSKSDFHDRILVSGYEARRLEAHTEQFSIRTVCNSDFAVGLGSSLSIGVQQLSSDSDAFMVFLADMPDISPDTVSKIISTYKNNRTKFSIVRPTHNGKPGHPVLFARNYQINMLDLDNDKGAFDIIRNSQSVVLEIETTSSAVIRDVDRKADLK